jgi:hypothetical protein
MEALTKSMNRLSWVVVLAVIAGGDTTMLALLLGAVRRTLPHWM